MMRVWSEHSRHGEGKQIESRDEANVTDKSWSEPEDLSSGGHEI